MKSRKRVVRVVFAFVMALSVLIGSGWLGMVAKGEERTLPVSGKSNDVEWSIDENGHLEISGSGNWEKTWMGELGVLDYGAPWCRYGNSIVSAKVTLTGATSLSYMFYGCGNLTELDLSGLDTGNVTDMGSMFYGCGNLTELDLNGLDTGNVKDMEFMFYRCGNLTELDLSGLDTGNVTDMGGMFFCCRNLTELNLSGLDTGNVKDMGHMFYGCTNLTELDLSGLDTGNVKDMGYMFYGCTNLTELDLSGLDTGNVKDMGVMFSGCGNLTELNLSGLDTGNVTDMGSMFSGCGNLTELDLSGLDTGNVTDMGGMFECCGNLTELNLSGLDTGNVTDMGGMFYGCTNLTELDLSGFETGNVTDMGVMFYGCTNLTELDLSGLDTGNVTYMEYMFSGCTNLTELDLSGLDTGNVKDMGYMFYGCTNLTELDLSGLDARSVTSMHWMFSGCANLTELDLSGFETGNVTTMYGMFFGCANLTELDLSGFATGNVTDMGSMFDGCTNLTELDLSGFATGNVTYMYRMFSGCNSLISIHTPAHVKTDCKLTGNGVWKDVDGNVYTMLPQNLDSGIYIYKIAYADLVAKAKAVVEETLSKITADNNTTREDIQEEVDRALTAAGITDVTVTVGELAKTEATESEAGSITGSIAIEAGSERDSVAIEKEIVRLPETQPDEDIDLADLVAKAKAVVEETLSKIAADNNTTREDIQEEVDRALAVAGITDVTVTVGELAKTEATGSEAGSITGSIAITAGDERDSVAIEKEIAKLPETQPDEDTDFADLVAKAKAVVEETLSKITADNNTTREDIQEEVDRALAVAGITDVTVTVGELTKTKATESEAGSITGSIAITAGDERDSVAIEKEIARLPETQPDEDTDFADLVAKTKAVVEETINKIIVDNDTTREDIQEEVDRALTAAGITDVTVTVGELAKTEATGSEAGSITGSVVIEAGNERDSVAIEKEIARLPETQPDEDTDRPGTQPDESKFDSENEVSTDIESSPDAEKIPEEDRITSITITPAFNLKDKKDDNVELDLSKITIKANEIYDEEGLRRAEEALGETISGNKHYNLLDLTLLYDGNDFSNGYVGWVKVVIPLPKGHRDKTFSCYRLTEVDGKMVKEMIPGTQTEDSYIIYLEHFSEYVLVADGGEAAHSHDFTGDWHSDESSHWKECECLVKSEVAAHSYGTWTTTKEATEKEEGSKERTCAVCGYKQMESVPKLSSTKPVTPSTSSDDGKKTDVSGNNAPNVSGATTVTVTSPKTGDNPMTGLAVLLLLSVVSMSATVIASRKRRNL